jgi:hypothetical protein
MRIMLHTSEQGRKNQNHAAEREIGFLLKHWNSGWWRKRYQSDYGISESYTKVNCYHALHAGMIGEPVMKSWRDKCRALVNGSISNFMILCGGSRELRSRILPITLDDLQDG